MWVIEWTKMTVGEQRWDAGPNDKTFVYPETKSITKHTLEEAQSFYDNLQHCESVALYECVKLKSKQKIKI
jgi:hypothetical protein